MEIRHLKLVKILVDEGSLTKATERLHLTQSALSHQLKEMEQEFNVNLFDRVGKNLVLTSYGTEVYKTACKVIKEEQDLKDRISLIEGGKKGSLRISTGCYTSYHWLPSLLRDFEKEYPGVRIEVEVDSTGKTLEKLINGDLDLGIINHAVPNRYIEYSVLFKDEMVALVSKDHPWTKKKYVIAKDFENEDLFIHSRPLDTVTVYREILKPQNIEPKSFMELPLTEAVVEMISNGYGISVMARWAVQPYLALQKVVPVSVTPQGLFRNHYTAMLKGRTPPLFLDNFLRHLKNNMKGKV